MQLPVRTRLNHALRHPLAPLLGILAIGIFLRLYNFPAVPTGLDRDELSAGYEAWSLLQFGTDRWGYHWPPYFYSWGSGQNVLYSYLSIPWIALFGLSHLSVRLTQVIFSIVTLPLLYLAVKRAYSRQVALIATLLLAVVPAGWLQARWGIESNLTPFTLTLLAYTLIRAFGVGDAAGQAPKRRWIIIALLPASLALYAYGLNLVPLAIIFALCLIAYRRTILANRQEWLISIMLFLLTALPFILFMAKNYLPRDTSQPFPLDGFLPFDVPQLFATRLAQVQSGSTGVFDTISGNLLFVLHGFSEGHRFSDTFLPSVGPVPILLVLLVLIVCLVRIVRGGLALLHRRWPRLTIFDFWLIGCLPLLGLFIMSTTESQAFVVPVLVVAATGLHWMYQRLRRIQPRVAIAAACVAVLAFIGINMRAFFTEYQTPVYTKLFAERFSPQLDTVLPAADRLARELHVPLYVSGRLNLGYMYTLWYLKIPATTFQASHPTVLNPDFGNYTFNAGTASDLKRYVYLEPKVTARDPERLRCEAKRVVQDTTYWRISVCTNS